MDNSKVINSNIVLILLSLSIITHNGHAATLTSKLNFTENSAPIENNSYWLQSEFYLIKALVKECTNKNLNLTSIQNNTGEYKTLLPTFTGCVQRKIFTALDKVLSMDVISLYDGFKLVRYRNYTPAPRKLDIFPTNKFESYYGWFLQFVQKVINVFHTHVLKVDVDAQVENSETSRLLSEFARRRRHRNSMMPIMIFGTLAMVLLLIPMGFKFLAVLGGKALLLAKMALILASIQGLKRIATSSVNYGLYNVPIGPPGVGGAGWNERNSQLEPYLYDAPQYYGKSAIQSPGGEADLQMTIG